MMRREFLHCCATAPAARGRALWAEGPSKIDPLKGITITDAHSHPDEFLSPRTATDLSSSMASIGWD